MIEGAGKTPTKTVLSKRLDLLAHKARNLVGVAELRI